jgi:hypothetical protein
MRILGTFIALVAVGLLGFGAAIIYMSTQPMLTPPTVTASDATAIDKATDDNPDVISTNDEAQEASQIDIAMDAGPDAASSVAAKEVASQADSVADDTRDVTAALAARPASPSLLSAQSYLGLANELAVTELAKFKELEERYSSRVRFYKNRAHPFNPESGVYIKWYREFSGYEVLDIMQSNSVLRPIIYEVRFDYTFMHTKWLSSLDADEFLDKDPLRDARAETEFRADGVYSLYRRYPCNRAGEYLGGLNPIPPRDFIPSIDYKTVVDGWSPRDLGDGKYTLADGTTASEPKLNQGFKEGRIPRKTARTRKASPKSLGQQIMDDLITNPPALPAAPAKDPEPGDQGPGDALVGEIDLNAQNLEALRIMVEEERAKGKNQ